MRKFVVFVLCAALSCGFVGCGGEVTADKVFEAISKEGNVVMDDRYTAKAKAQDDAE